MLQQLSKYISDIQVEHFAEIDSTNTYLANKPFENGKSYLVYADLQTAGRGRRNSEWISDGQNIYATLGFKCNKSLNDLPFLSLAVAVAISQALEEELNDNQKKNLKIKLPNDIYYKNSKLAGILIETKGIKRDGFDIIIGFGVNVNMHQISKEIDRAWTSLAMILGRDLQIENLLVNIVRNIKEIFEERTEDMLKIFHCFDYIYNKEVIFDDGENKQQGIARGVFANRTLLLETPTGKKHIDIANINKLRIVNES